MKRLVLVLLLFLLLPGVFADTEAGSVRFVKVVQIVNNLTTVDYGNSIPHEDSFFRFWRCEDFSEGRENSWELLGEWRAWFTKFPYDTPNPHYKYSQVFDFFKGEGHSSSAWGYKEIQLNHPVDGLTWYTMRWLMFYVDSPLQPGDVLMYAAEVGQYPLAYNGSLPYYGETGTGDYTRVVILNGTSSGTYNFLELGPLPLPPSPSPPPSSPPPPPSHAHALVLDPTFGSPGEKVTLSGYDFTKIAGTEIMVNLTDTPSSNWSIPLGVTQTLVDGSFSITFVIPAISFEDYTIIASDEYGVTATTDFEIGIIAMLIDPTSGPIGTKVTLTAVGFEPGFYNVSFGSTRVITNGIIPYPSAISDSFIIPNVSPGIHRVTIEDSGNHELFKSFHVPSEEKESVPVSLDNIPVNIESVSRAQREIRLSPNIVGLIAIGLIAFLISILALKPAF